MQNASWSFSIFFVLLLISVTCSSDKYNPNPVFVSNAKAAHNSSRLKHVSKMLQSTAGVYTDKLNKHNMILNKTVFMSVAAFNQDNIAHYKVYFKNFLCFVKHYEIDLLLYIVHHDIKNLESEITSLELLGVRVLTYPDELFWKLVATKTNSINSGKGFAEYSGKTPSFASYGALVMLVPVLEVLELGYNVMYFDVDIGLVQNPVPFLSIGNADFITSIEMRNCPEFISISKPETLWETLEPNTGVMHVRATRQGRALFRSWLEHIVHENVMNDQRAFDRKKLGVEYRADCNYVNHTEELHTLDQSNASSRKPTYCLLSEALFQNGMIAVQCPTKPSARDSWLIGMDKFGSVGPSALTNGSMDARFPVSVHVNYCKAKSHELQVRGLWLLSDQHNESVCKQYKQHDTYYSTGLNWTSELQSIQLKRENLYRSISVNGTLLQRFGGREVYLMDANHELRQVPDKNTFESLFGEDWRIVKTVPTETMERFRIGTTLNRVTN